MNEKINLVKLKQELDYLDNSIKVTKNLLTEKLVCKETETWLNSYINNQLQVQNTRQIVESLISKSDLEGEI